MTRIYLAIAAAAILAVSHWFVYDAGVDTERARHQVRGARAYATAVETVAKVGDAVATIGRDLSDRLEQSRESERTSVRTVTRIIRENPDFAAVRRPAELERLRRDQLAAIARAAEARRVQR